MTTIRADASGLTLVSASAGSGKTYRLTAELTEQLHDPALGSAAVAGLMAVTYTTKAQAELESRLRQALVEAGQLEQAEALPLAYLGTVHAVCLRLIKEFALDAGLSPLVDGLPQEAARRLLQEALEHEIAPALRRRLVQLAGALELNLDPRSSRFDWITPVEQIMTLARNNRMAPAQLPEMARRSTQGFLALFSVPQADGERLERELAREVAAALAALGDLPDPPKVTSDALAVLRDCQHQLRMGRLPWSKWCKLSKLEPGKRALPWVTEVRQAAAQYEVHPTFQAQIREMSELIFEAARSALTAYARWKTERGLVDYIDMIDHALTLLEHPEVNQELEQRLELLAVDEFQDTSPIQLALFTRLHALSKRSLWVGDRKQCIFEYAGADPGLMEAVADWVREQGGETEVLGKNFRSRPELVQFTSALFARAFASHGHPSHEVRTTPERVALPELAALPALGVWWFPAKHSSEALAQGVQRLLSRPTATPILDRKTGQVRALRAGDVAIIVATNREAEQLAEALKNKGIASALPRTGLMGTPEGILLARALAVLVNKNDTLASAEIEALHAFDGQHHEQWLSERVRSHLAGEKPLVTSAAVQSLDPLRDQLPLLSPTEVVDRVMALLDLPKLARRWPDPTQRLANLDALRALAVAYEDRSAYLREAASLAGLLRYFQETQVAVRQQDEERASDEQHVERSDSAVVLSTYHKAKGLEWPVVILGSLDRPRKRGPFDLTPETDRAAFDASDPLGNRWLRYWPWPLGAQRDAPIRDRAQASEAGQRIAKRDARERVRLLYVGFTRARDHLILATSHDAKGKGRLEWLSELRDDQGLLLSLPEPDTTPPMVSVRDSPHALSVPARVWALTGDDDEVDTPPDPAPLRWYASTSHAPANIRYAIHPSTASDDVLVLPQARAASKTRFTGRIPFTQPAGVSWDQIGTALHAFLAADGNHLALDERLDLARSILSRAELDTAFEPPALVSASNALTAFVDQRWPNARWHRKSPSAPSSIPTPARVVSKARSTCCSKPARASWSSTTRASRGAPSCGKSKPSSTPRSSCSTRWR